MNPKNCPVCHAPIPENAPGGLCPACVLRDADEPKIEAADAPSLADLAAAFPKLEILRLIGHGGMGFVYQARQPELDRTVALKILSPALRRDPAFEERFAREARVLGKLQHPNIVTLFEHGESGGFFYLMMEYIDGVNLRQAMTAGRFTPEQALAIVPAICDALQSAHAQNVWHRDIKPENILLDRDGRVKIADFGIARILGDPERNFTLTRTGGMLGSAAYMAPEQHEKPHAVDHRADIYSLGVVIYEMLTGELPLGRFPAPSQRAVVNSRIDEIVFRTLEKERELRQQSADEVKTEFGNTSTAEEPLLKNIGQPELGSKWVIRALALLVGGGTVAGAAALIADSFRDAQTQSMMMVLVALGGAAAALGYLGSLRALYEMTRGRFAPTHRTVLMAFVFWPTLAALPFLGTLSWFSWFKKGAEPLAATGAGVLGYAIIAIAVPLLVSKTLWNQLGRDLMKAVHRRTDVARIAGAVILAVSAVALARYVPYQECQFRSYHSRFIQLYGEIRESEDLPLVREALDRALGDSRSDFRVAIRGSNDPANPLRVDTPVVILECSSAGFEISHRQFDAVSTRLRASLPKRIGVNSAGGAGSDDPESPPMIHDGYRAVRALNILLLAIPIAIVLLAVPASGMVWLLPALSSLLAAAALWGSPWPRLPRDFPPQLHADKTLPPLSAPEYDFSTTRDAMESLIKAAKKGDEEAFKRGISTKLLEMILAETTGLSEPMGDIAKLTYHQQISQTGDHAEVEMTNKETKKTSVMTLIRENGDWRLNLPAEDRSELKWTITEDFTPGQPPRVLEFSGKLTPVGVNSAKHASFTVHLGGNPVFVVVGEGWNSRNAHSRNGRELWGNSDVGKVFTYRIDDGDRATIDQKTYDLIKGRVFLYRPDGTFRQIAMRPARIIPAEELEKFISELPPES